MKKQLLTIEQIAAFHGVTIDAIKAQYLANAQGMETLYQKALKTGKKVNGKPASFWALKIEEFKNLAA